MNDVVEIILNTYQSMCPLDAERAADSRQKISRYIETLSSAGQRDAEQLTIYGLAYLTELHEGQDPRWRSVGARPCSDGCAGAEEPASGPDCTMLVGDRLLGVALLALGDLEGARRQIERMLSARQELATPPNTTLD